MPGRTDKKQKKPTKQRSPLLQEADRHEAEVDELPVNQRKEIQEVVEAGSLEFLFSKPPINITALTLDAMYYHAALKSMQRAREAEPEVQKALLDFEPLRVKSEAILQRHGGNALRAYDQLESLYIQMDGTNERIGFAYSPLLEALALTHILCAAALESHINARASELLSGKMYKKFDRIDLEFKWLLLPKLLGKAGFDLDAEPFQGFNRLIKFRNHLVHYRELHEPWADPGVPSFLEKLGLTLTDGSKSLNCVCGMVSTFAQQMGQPTPYWLGRGPGDISCFEFRCID